LNRVSFYHHPYRLLEDCEEAPLGGDRISRDMPASILLLISGAPCTGKTTLGSRLAADLKLPFIYKDGIKERLFNRLGSKEVAFSKLLSLSTYDILYYFIQSQLEAGCSLAVEANFKVGIDSTRFQDLQDRFKVNLLQVHCHASREVLLDRYKRRAESPDRHAGHLDHLTYEDLQASLARRDYAALQIQGPRFEVDTTDFSSLNYSSLIAALRTEIDSYSHEAAR
jgi:predicted kinase